MLVYKNWLFLIIGTASVAAALIGFAKYSSNIPVRPQLKETKEIAHGGGHHVHHHSRYGSGYGYHYAHHHYHDWYWYGGRTYLSGWGSYPGFNYDPNYYYSLTGTPSIQYNPEPQQQTEQNLRFGNPNIPSRYRPK